MEKNVGGTEAMVRGAAGAALIGGALLAPVDTKWKVAMGLGGLGLAGSAATGYCAVNAALGRSSAEPSTAADGSLIGVEFKQMGQFEQGASAGGPVM